MPISLPQEASLAAHRLPPTNDPRVHPTYPGRPRGRTGHCPTTSRDDGQVQTDASAGPAAPAPASSTRRRLRQTTSRSWTQRATTPTPAIPAIRLPAHAALQDLTSAGHSARGNAQTPDADTGRRHRTADTWTLRRPHRTQDIGPVDRQAWTLVARTGHRTPDAGRGRGQADEGAAGIRTSWATTPSDRSTAHAGSAVRPPSSARSRLAGSCLVAPPGSSGASAHCCPRIRWVESRADREASSVMMEGCAAVIEAKQIAVVAERNWSERCRAPVA
jgi:hypothetical protein